MGEAIRIYNSSVEIAIRSLLILYNLPNQKASIDYLMILDHLSLNTFDLGGPASIHAPVPNRGVQLYSRKEIMDKSIRLLIAKNLVELNSSPEGFTYKINGNGIEYLKYFESKYFERLAERVQWVVKNFGSKSEKTLKDFVSENLDKWGEEFMSIENQFSNL